MLTSRQSEIVDAIRSRGWSVKNHVERFEYNKNTVEEGVCPDDIVFLNLSFQSDVATVLEVK